jgi:prevent-host-death family protein
MGKHYSIAEARQDLAAIVHEAETSGPIQFTRRGKSVAVLLSQADYEKLTGERISFWDAYQAFRAEHDLEALDIDPEIFNVRDSSPGRDVTF